MVLKAIAMFFVNIFKGLIYLIKSFFDNLYLLYLYAYIIYGIYLATKHKEQLNTTYIFFGLILITIFFIDYIDKKFKKEKYKDPKKEIWEKNMASTERIINERINELSSLIEDFPNDPNGDIIEARLTEAKLIKSNIKK